MAKFNSINEMNTFDFRDCYITSVIIQKSLDFEVEALIVKPNNSQNTNFTESYLGTTKVSFADYEILDGIKDGFKYYNADDVLIKERPDEQLGKEELVKLLNNAEGMYLYEVENYDGTFTLHLEEVDEEEFGSVGESYSITVKSSSVNVSWDRYMNRVEH